MAQILKDESKMNAASATLQTLIDDFSSQIFEGTYACKVLESVWIGDSKGYFSDASFALSAKFLQTLIKLKELKEEIDFASTTLTSTDDAATSSISSVS